MKEFSIDTYQMATLLLVNAAMVDIIERGTVSKYTMEEIQFLQPRLYSIFEKIDSAQ